MSMIETKGPRPYHVGRYGSVERFIEIEGAKGFTLPADWVEPRHPGDSIMTIYLVKDDEIGDVRVQWYGNDIKPKDGDTLKVGAFLPGVIECSPGDTPKCWPDKSEYVTSRAAASRLLIQYLIAAFRDGWSVKK